MISFVFFGTPYPARDTLEVLKTHGYVPRVIITNPDAPQGRGQQLAPSLVKTWAEENDIPVLTPATLDDEAVGAILETGSELGICVAYGKILPKKLIEGFPRGILNVHYSLLPEYRGASPVEAALLHGDTRTGVTVQKMAYELDAGDIVAAEAVDIFPHETAKELRPRLVTIGANLLVSALPGYLEGSIVPATQEHERATHSGKIKKEDGLLDLAASGIDNWNKYRAFAERPGTYFFTERNGKQIRVKITKARYSPEEGFVIERVTPEGKKETDYAAFLKAA